MLWLIAGVVLLAGCAGAARMDAASPAVLVDRVQADAVVRDVAALLAPEGVVARSRFDGCQTGRDGWKMNDPDFVCTVVESQVVPVAAGDRDVAEGLAAVREAMAGLDCPTASRFLQESDLRSPATTPMSFRCEGSGLQMSVLALDADSGVPQPADVYGAPVSHEFERVPFPDDVMDRVAQTDGSSTWQLTVSRTYALQD